MLVQVPGLIATARSVILIFQQADGHRQVVASRASGG